MTTAILIVLTGSLGDIARALCLPAHLKKHFPACRLTWLVESRWAELISDHPHIDRTIVFERAWRPSVVTNILRQLKGDSYDIALDLQRILKSGLLSKASGAKRRIGFHPRNAKELNWVFNNEYIGFYSDDLPKLQHYLKFADHLGLPAASELDFGLKAMPGPSGAAGLGKLPLPYIAVVTGSSWASKNWQLEGYHALLTKILAARRHSVVLLGDQTQAAVARRLTDRLHSEQVIDRVNRTSLRELVTVLAHADAAVGPDTGTGHLAAAVQTPYVTLLGPTAPERVAPYGCENLVVHSQTPCAPCGKEQCTESAYDCMGGIRAEAVFDMLESALVRRRPSRD